MEPKIKMEAYHLVYMSSLLGDEKSIVRIFFYRKTLKLFSMFMYISKILILLKKRTFEHLFSVAQKHEKKSLETEEANLQLLLPQRLTNVAVTGVRRCCAS